MKTTETVMDGMRAAIFDLDGVIVDTAKYHYQAWRRLANHLGFDFSEADNERLKGVSRVQSLEIILELGKIQLEEGQKAVLAEQKNRWYVELISAMDERELLPGAVGFLQHLRQRNIRVALGSASKNAALILDRMGIAGLFDSVIDGTRTSRSKPDPEVFLLGAEALATDPARCVVFEDSAAGVEAAKRAGMRAVGIGTAAGLPRADFIVSGLHELAPAD